MTAEVHQRKVVRVALQLKQKIARVAPQLRQKIAQQAEKQNKEEFALLFLIQNKIFFAEYFFYPCID